MYGIVPFHCIAFNICGYEIRTSFLATLDYHRTAAWIDRLEICRANRNEGIYDANPTYANQNCFMHHPPKFDHQKKVK